MCKDYFALDVFINSKMLNSETVFGHTEGVDKGDVHQDHYTNNPICRIKLNITWIVVAAKHLADRLVI